MSDRHLIAWALFGALGVAVVVALLLVVGPGLMILAALIGG